MVSTLGDDAPFSAVKKWAAEIKGGRESLEDYPCSRRPSTANTQENVDSAHDIIMGDRRVTTRYIASIVGISHERVENIWSPMGKSRCDINDLEGHRI